VVTRWTVGRLWARYLKVRKELRRGEGFSDEEARREAERQEGQFRDRLVVNYSPLVKYVASRVGARAWGGRAGGHDLLGSTGVARCDRDLRPGEAGQESQVRIVRDLQDSVGYPRPAP
jgi:hypothetical protein